MRRELGKDRARGAGTQCRRLFLGFFDGEHHVSLSYHAEERRVQSTDGGAK